jgi:Tfp pilus assembly protein PilX
MRLRIPERDEAGGTLIFVLVILVFVGTIAPAVLGQTTANLRRTIVVRDQAGATYNADGAGQIAVNALRKSTFNNDSTSATYPQCFGATGNLTLPNFYPAIYGQKGTAASSAYVTCAAEAGTGAAGGLVPVTSANKPGNAILTLSTTETGQTYGQSNKTINIRGSVQSDSTIDSSSASLTLTGTGSRANAVGACIGSVTPACTHSGSVPDPNYPAPTTAPVAVTGSNLPSCNNKNQVAEFKPGLYTSADTFNNCKASWFYFDPGQYYFDFQGTGTHVWDIGNTVVGGTLTAAKSNNAPAVPGACVNPITTTSAVGVQFAFGGDSQIVFDKGAMFEICATYSATTIPTAAYGLKTTLGSGANTVHAESGCITAVGAGNCNLFNAPGNGTKPDFYFEGFAYAPLATATLTVNNTSAQHFNFGVVFRTLSLTTTGSVDTNVPIISLPDNSPGYGTSSTIVDLNVYICPGVSTCGATGTLQLTARVLVYDPTGSPVTGSRQMKILSWSQIR